MNYTQAFLPCGPLPLLVAGVFSLTCAVLLCLDKTTAGLFSTTLYLLLLSGKSFRARQLKATTLCYHKEEEKWRRTEGEEWKVFVWWKGERRMHMFEADSECGVKCSLYKRLRLPNCLAVTL